MPVKFWMRDWGKSETASSWEELVSYLISDVSSLEWESSSLSLSVISSARGCASLTKRDRLLVRKTATLKQSKHWKTERLKHWKTQTRCTHAMKEGGGNEDEGEERMKRLKIHSGRVVSSVRHREKRAHSLALCHFDTAFCVSASPSKKHAILPIKEDARNHVPGLLCTTVCCISTTMSIRL